MGPCTSVHNTSNNSKPSGGIEVNKPQAVRINEVPIQIKNRLSQRTKYDGINIL